MEGRASQVNSAFRGKGAGDLCEGIHIQVNTKALHQVLLFTPIKGLLY